MEIGAAGTGFGSLVLRVINGVSEHNCAGYSAQAAYYFLFSLFPFLLFLVTLLAYLPVPDLFEMIMKQAGKLLPPEALRLVEDNVRTVVREQKGGLLSLGAILSLTGSTGGMTAVMEALNRVFGVEETRHFLVVQATALVMVVVFSLLIASASVLLLFGRRLGSAVAVWSGLGDRLLRVWENLRWPMILAFSVTAVSGVYRFGPNVQTGLAEGIPGAVFAVVAWVGASLLFSWYTRRFGSYEKTYGSIGAVIVLLTWLYVSAFVLLLGGEINAALLPER